MILLYIKKYFKKLLFNVNILILILQMALQEENLNHNLSEIILTIEGTGKQQILSNSFNILPTKVKGDCYLMNDKKYVECQKNENIVNIFFDKEINSAEKMFTDLKNIKSIDLSKFDSSKINNMNEMFSNCYKLEYINLDNFNTSSVSNMNGIFRHCESLKFLNLASFNTEHVIYMFNMFFLL